MCQVEVDLSWEENDGGSVGPFLPRKVNVNFTCFAETDAHELRSAVDWLRPSHASSSTLKPLTLFSGAFVSQRESTKVH